MYNGIGLTTARGSGTNGFVQRNLSFVRKHKDRIDYKSEEELKKLDQSLIKQPNREILDHERKRKVELKCMEMQELMEEQGRFSTQKRDLNEVKKKYYNIKSKSKEKNDKVKRPKTGGGPSVSFTPAEEAFLNHMEGRPQLDGLPDGIDTDECQLKEPESEATSTQVIQQIDGNLEKSTDENVESAAANTASSTSNSIKNRKRSSRKSLATLEEENLRLDNQRLEQEIEKIKLEKDILILKKVKLIHELQLTGMDILIPEC